MAEHDDVIAAGLIFMRCERASHSGPQPEHVEVRG